MNSSPDRKFAILLHVKGIHMKDAKQGVSPGERVGRQGMYCWRSVRASSEREAVVRAIQELRRDARLFSEIEESPSSSLDIIAEEVHELDPRVNLERMDSGMVFYVETSGRKRTSRDVKKRYTKAMQKERKNRD